MCKWEKVKLGEVCDFHNHKRVPLSSLQREKRKGQYPYYGASGIIDYLDDYIFDGKYLLISEDGENLRSRKTEIAFFAKGKFWVNNHAHIVTARENLDIDFLYYYIKTLNISPYITGAVQPKLNKASLENIELPLPPLKEQKRIAAILSSLDDKIEVNNQINKNLEEQAQAIFKSWFVDFEPFGGVMPSDWREGTLKDYCKMKSGFAFKSSWWQDNGTPVIKIKNITTSGLNMGEHSCVPEDKETLAKDCIARQGDVLIAMTGATIGKSCIVPKHEKKMLINQRVGKFFLGDTPLEKLPYLWCILRQQKVFDEIVNKGQGSAQPNVSPSDIESIEIVYTDAYIKKFNLLLKSNFEKITENMFENVRLSQTRDALLPKLINGELNV